MQAQFHREQYILITTFRYSMCFGNNAQYSDCQHFDTVSFVKRITPITDANLYHIVNRETVSVVQVCSLIWKSLCLVCAYIPGIVFMIRECQKFLPERILFPQNPSNRESLAFIPIQMA